MPTVDDARTIRSLRQAWTVFLQYPSPRLLALHLIIALRWRLLVLADEGLASLTWWDLAIPMLVFGVVWPLTEWVLHKYVLHLRPRELFGRRFDPYFARKHRDHHGEPWHLPHVFLPARVVLTVVPPVLLLVWLLIPPPGLALTTMVTLTAVALHYEWIHYLTHTSVPPRTEWFRRVRRSHRYHHFKNERYWYGFTLPLVDRLLGTSPSPTQIETSKTARTLNVEPE
jgi:hypothetical protein